MTEQEKFNAECQIRLAKQDAKFEFVMNELKEQREDIRRLNAKLDDTFKQTMIGTGAMIVALGGFLVAVLGK